ncbi:MAG: hypothetical protein ACRD5R_06565, partial [Candidatus Acidiferrales bacterium]
MKSISSYFIPAHGRGALFLRPIRNGNVWASSGKFEELRVGLFRKSGAKLTSMNRLLKTVIFP